MKTVINLVVALAAVASFQATLASAQTFFNDSDSDDYVGVEYHVWSHPSPLEGMQIFRKFFIPQNSSVYNMMEFAAAYENQDQSLFMYEFRQYTFGKQITSIGGVRENADENNFWFLYELEDSPDPNNPPSQDSLSKLGVDDIQVRDGDVYLFWLTKIEYLSSV